MADLSFDVALDWHGEGRKGDGICTLGGARVPYAAPAGMGGTGTGTNPEELLVAAVSSCYSITLSVLLRSAGLPCARLAVRAEGIVTGFPQETRFAAIVVNPTIGGADLSRRAAYLDAARSARDRCFVGRSVRDSLEYRVGEIVVEA